MKIEIVVDPQRRDAEAIARMIIDGRPLVIMPNGEAEPLLVGKTSANNTLGDLIADFFKDWAPAIAAAELNVRASGPVDTWEPLTETVYEKAEDALFFS